MILVLVGRMQKLYEPECLGYNEGLISNPDSSNIIFCVIYTSIIIKSPFNLFSKQACLKNFKVLEDWGHTHINCSKKKSASPHTNNPHSPNGWDTTVHMYVSDTKACMYSTVQWMYCIQCTLYIQCTAYCTCLMFWPNGTTHHKLYSVHCTLLTVSSAFPPCQAWFLCGDYFWERVI